ncbi:MAG: flagellar hook-basal body protein [Pseudomonadota bacterium]
MTNALIAAAHSMHNDLRYMDTISQNMVNMTTPGYKRSIPVTQAFGDVMYAAGGAATSGSSSIGTNHTGVNAFSGLTPVMSHTLDMSTGPVKQTGRPWDVAIVGDGYFEVATSDGSAYTRAGDFHLDRSGRLVSVAGFAVQGKSGDIVVNGNNAVIDHAGNVMQEGVSVGQIKIVQFKDGNSLLKTPDGLLRPDSANGTVATISEVPAELQAGYLESSNVTPLREMISMMETTHHFEAAQKLFQGYDEMLRTAIQKLGEF